MKIQYTQIILVIVFLLTACTDEDPTTPDAKACFSIEPSSSIMVGDTIEFLNCSENSGDYIWSFGDGLTSQDDSPNHIFASAGEYDVMLVAINETSADTLSQTITVEKAPVDASNYMAFNGVKYPLKTGFFHSVSNFEVDNSGRYHEIILIDQDSYDEDTYTGNIVNLTIITDAQNVNKITGSFTKEASCDDATECPDYAWRGISLEKYSNGEYDDFFIVAESVTEFSIALLEGNLYEIKIKGTGASGTDANEENGTIELYFKGNLTLEE